MKKLFMVFLALIVTTTSCGLLKKKIKVEDAVTAKIQIENTTNPAKKYLILNDLKDKRVILDDVVVKKITESTNIDYDFCILVDVVVENKNIECYIYTKNVYKISKLKEGESRINVIGDFSRFFTMLDEYYAKLEVVEAKVTVLEDKDASKTKKEKNNKQKDK